MRTRDKARHENRRCTRFLFNDEEEWRTTDVGKKSDDEENFSNQPKHIITPSFFSSPFVYEHSQEDCNLEDRYIFTYFTLLLAVYSFTHSTL